MSNIFEANQDSKGPKLWWAYFALYYRKGTDEYALYVGITSNIESRIDEHRHPEKAEKRGFHSCFLHEEEGYEFVEEYMPNFLLNGISTMMLYTEISPVERQIIESLQYAAERGYLRYTDENGKEYTIRRVEGH